MENADNTRDDIAAAEEVASIGDELSREMESGTIAKPGARVGSVTRTSVSTSVVTIEKHLPEAGSTSEPTEWVACPECGEGALIDPLQRRAQDFCVYCDFPLFWARSAILASATEDTGASLRRLPGTVGRAATAAVLCPHCGEPNTPTALICIRCSEAMTIVEPEPEVVPEVETQVVIEPEPEPEPEADNFTIWLVALILVMVLLVTIGVWNTYNS